MGETNTVWDEMGFKVQNSKLKSNLKTRNVEL